MRKKVVDWSKLPEELVDLVADRVFSNVELLRVRTICKPWRSAVSTNKRIVNHHNRKRNRSLSPYNGEKCLLSPAAFFRVVPSSSPKKGWLIKSQEETKIFQRKKQKVPKSFQDLLSPLSRTFIGSSDKALDLLDYTVSEIHQTYNLELYKNKKERRCDDFVRVVLVGNLVFAIDNRNETLWCCNSEDTSKNAWTRISDKAEYFSDIIVHNGHIYALDLSGAIWWISLSQLNIYQYRPSTSLAYYEIDDCKDKSLVEYNGDICVIHRFCKDFTVKKRDIMRTVGFKVYKMDEETVEWVQVTSLGDKAIVMATDSCFTVVAGEYHGCLENSIYFTDEDEKDIVKVFKLGDCSVTTSAESSSDESCFQMFSPPFA